MILGLRGFMDADGDIQSWPTLYMQHSDVLAQFGHIVGDYRVRWRQWDDTPGAAIDFDPGYERADAIKVCEYVLRIQQPALAADPAAILAFARKSGVR